MNEVDVDKFLALEWSLIKKTAQNRSKITITSQTCEIDE